jgi:hypothetical protein
MRRFFESHPNRDIIRPAGNSLVLSSVALQNRG